MIEPRRYFPWKIARQFFLTQVGFILALSLILSLSLNDLALVLVAAIAFYAYLTYWYVRPLSRLIQKARLLRRTNAPIDEADELNEDVGEWYDLERSLNRMHSELRTKTELLSREREELSTLIGGVFDAILAVDVNGDPLFYNSRFALQFNAPRGGEQAKAFSLSEIFRTPEILTSYREVLRTGERRLTTVTLQIELDEVPRHFSLSIAPLKREGGERVYGALGVFHDVTELKQSEQIRIEFVANASHELRTPLTSIKGYVDTLKADLKQERYDDLESFVDVISRNVDRLGALISDLLDLSTLESGAEVKKTSISTREITESVLRQLEVKRARKRQEIKVDYLAETLWADPRRVEQVLVNLVHNAIKYVPETKQISIVWEAAPDATLLKVRDNGPGIPIEHQARLFERFYRVDPGRSRDQGGTGLGLAIVKHIMIKHDGSVRVVSRPGEGAEFVCVFPEES